MRLAVIFAATAAAGLATAASAAAEPSLEIRHAAVRVVVMPEARADVMVEVLKANPRLPLYIDRVGDQVIVDGHLPGFLTGCHGSGQNLRAQIFGRGDFKAEEFPQIVVHTPMDVRVHSGGVSVGSIGRAHSVELREGGCGSWTVANVEDLLSARLSGSGEIEAGTSRRAELGLSGVGRLRAAAIADTLEGRVSGSGLIDVTSAQSAELVVSGSGNVRAGTIPGGLTAEISGSGDVSVARVDGPLRARLSGVGHIRVPAGQVTVLQAHISGSGDVDFGGVAQTLEADVSGSGDIHVGKVTGQVDKRVSGSGQVTVGP
ncbi:MAG TPA: DUF2807 domain-containing protein [Caulobacteraceae bacterium]|nr:DUF2807 domain-containing protein [Caulobacteraceae bacterium]